MSPARRADRRVPARSRLRHRRRLVRRRGRPGPAARPPRPRPLLRAGGEDVCDRGPHAPPRLAHRRRRQPGAPRGVLQGRVSSPVACVAVVVVVVVVAGLVGIVGRAVDAGARALGFSRSAAAWIGRTAPRTMLGSVCTVTLDPRVAALGAGGVCGGLGLRLRVLRQLLIKYGVADGAGSSLREWRCRAFVADGTTFAEDAPDLMSKVDANSPAAAAAAAAAVAAMAVGSAWRNASRAAAGLPGGRSPAGDGSRQRQLRRPPRRGQPRGGARHVPVRLATGGPRV